MFDIISVLVLLIALELVLGVDNIVVITIAVARLPESQRNKARIIGLTLALVARVVMIGLVFVLAQLENPIWLGFSVKDLVLLAGGGFLIWKAITEMHHTVELEHEKDRPTARRAKSTFGGALTMIVLMDIVFSIDSVITAIGLTDNIWVIVSAVLLSFIAVLAFAKPIGEFILENPSFKILALSFLVVIGVVLFAEGMHHHIPKPYIYLPMGFATVIQILQWRMERNRLRKTQTS